MIKKSLVLLATSLALAIVQPMAIAAVKPGSACLKVGQTTQEVNVRIKQSQGVAQVPYILEVDEAAERFDGSFFRDSTVRERLKQKGFENVELEWMRCTASDVLASIKELQDGKVRASSRSESFKLRTEQSAAVKKTADYFNSIWAEDKKAVPRFLWNAKMRFGKTFASYHLAKNLDAKRVLVVTFKPAVEDAWQVDLESHVDFEGWQYFSKATGGDPTIAKKNAPLVYFGSFQDLLGRDKATGTIKAKNEWLHTTNWDLVIFDEYHFGAWRDSAKELFEGEDANEAKKQESHFWLESNCGITEFGHRGAPAEYLTRVFRSNGDWNAAHIADSKLDAAIDEYNTATTPAKAMVASKKIQELSLDLSPYIIAYFEVRTSAVRKGLKGFYTNGMGQFDAAATA